MSQIKLVVFDMDGTIIEPRSRGLKSDFLNIR